MNSIFLEGSDDLPPCLIFPARKKHTATILFAHGLGDTAKNLAQFLGDLTQHPDLEHVKFILPSAPIMSITGMHGRSIPAWFNCYSFDHANRKEDEQGIYKSVKWMHDLISKEEKEHNIPSNRIVVGGFSQGGSIAIFTGITTERALAGIFALSGYVPLRSKVPEVATQFAKNTPIIWCHGEEDSQVDHKVWKELAKTLAGQLSMPFVPSDFSSTTKLTRQELEGKKTAELLFHSYEGLGHWFDEGLIENLCVWISVHLPDTDVQSSQ